MKKKAPLLVAAIVGCFIGNIIYKLISSEPVRPIYKVVETMKWDSIQKHEHEYVYSIQMHQKISVLVDQIVKNEKLKRLYYTFNDSTLTRFVDSLKEVETAIDFYDLEKRKTRCSERFNDFKPHHYYKPHLP